MTTQLNTVLFGDVRQTLASLPARLFHCCVTSPPYWNLRSYLKSDDPLKQFEIGSEPTPQAFVETMVGVFREVRRVLRDDGVLWVNLGDSYATSGGERKYGSSDGGTGRGEANGSRVAGDGSQLLMPHRVALAMQADGWILRSTVVWAKRSPMPESISGYRWQRCRVKVAACDRAGNPGRDGDIQRQSAAVASRSQREAHDPSKNWQPCPGCPKCLPHDGYVLRRGKWRCTTGHEYVFMFAKSDRYFCDGDAVQEPQSQGTLDRFGKNNSMNCARGKSISADQGTTLANGDYKSHLQAGVIGGRNPRSVWSLSSEPYKDAHFATFPTELARRCIAASTSKGGCCAECGAPYAPVVESERVPTRPGLDNQIDPAGMANRDPQRHVARTTVSGYRATCACEADKAPCRVLDPFGGSGTVGQVARHLGHDYVLCELNRDYLPMIERRIEAVPRWKLKANGKAKQPKPSPEQSLLFT